MNAENTLRAHLLADATLGPLIDGRVYPGGLLAQETAYPAITLQRIDSNYYNTRESSGDVGRARWQADIYAPRYGDTQTVALAFGRAVVSVSSDDPRIDGAEIIDRRNGYTPTTRLYRVSIDFYLYAEET